MKFCKDCKYYFVSIYNIHLCNRLIIGGNNDLVRGPEYRELCSECAFERQYTSTKYTITCGPEAQFWKPTLKYRIIKLFKKNEDSTTK